MHSQHTLPQHPLHTLKASLHTLKASLQDSYLPNMARRTANTSSSTSPRSVGAQTHAGLHCALGCSLPCMSASPLAGTPQSLAHTAPRPVAVESRAQVTCWLLLLAVTQHEQGHSPASLLAAQEPKC